MLCPIILFLFGIASQFSVGLPQNGVEAMYFMWDHGFPIVSFVYFTIMSEMRLAHYDLYQQKLIHKVDL